MRRKISMLTLILFVFVMLTGCGPAEALGSATTPQDSTASLPGRMVRSIDVSIAPNDPDFHRHYQSQRNLNGVLNLLREMETSDYPQQVPPLGFGQTYFIITATYATGQQQQYLLLNDRYLKIGDNPWCEISQENAMVFTGYLRDHPSDDGPEPVLPTLPQQDPLQPIV